MTTVPDFIVLPSVHLPWSNSSSIQRQQQQHQSPGVHVSSIDESITGRQNCSIQLLTKLLTINLSVTLILCLIYSSLNHSPLDVNWLTLITILCLTYFLLLWTINLLKFLCKYSKHFFINLLIDAVNSSFKRVNQLTKQRKVRYFSLGKVTLVNFTSFYFILTIHLNVITLICFHFSVPVTGYAIQFASKKSLEQSNDHLTTQGTSLLVTRSKIHFNKQRQQLNLPTQVDKVDESARKLDTINTSMESGLIWTHHQVTINQSKGTWPKEPLNSPGKSVVNAMNEANATINSPSMYSASESSLPSSSSPAASSSLKPLSNVFNEVNSVRLKRQAFGKSVKWIEPPFNVTIVLTSWFPPAVRISWQVSNDSLPTRHLITGSFSSIIDANETNDISPSGKVKIGSFRVAYALNVLNSPYPKKYLEVPSSVTNLTIDRLLPLREYFVEVESWSLDRKLSNTSRQILFTSPSNDSTLSYPYYIPSMPLPPSPNSGITSGNLSSPPTGPFLPHPSSYYPLYPPPRGGKYRPSRMKSIYYHPSFHGQDGDIELPFIKLDEAIIVIFVLCFWMGVIGLFCNKWGKIRHLEPYHPDYHKRESTDTEIVDPFSSFSERQHVPGATTATATAPGQPGSTAVAKLSSRMNTLTNNNVNSASISNFASIDLSGNPNVIGTGGEAIVINPMIGGSLGESSTLRPLNSSVRKASLSLNEVSNLAVGTGHGPVSNKVTTGHTHPRGHGGGGYFFQRSGSSTNRSIGYHTASDRGGTSSSDHKTSYTGANIMGSAAAHSYYHQIQKQYQAAHQARQVAIASAGPSIASPSTSPFAMVALGSNSPSGHHAHHHVNHHIHHSSHHHVAPATTMAASGYTSYHRNSYVNYATCPSSASASAYSSHRPSFSLSYGAYTPSRRRSSVLPSPIVLDENIITGLTKAATRSAEAGNSGYGDDVNSCNVHSHGDQGTFTATGDDKCQQSSSNDQSTEQDKSGKSTSTDGKDTQVDGSGSKSLIPEVSYKFCPSRVDFLLQGHTGGTDGQSGRANNNINSNNTDHEVKCPLRHPFHRNCTCSLDHPSGTCSINNSTSCYDRLDGLTNDHDQVGNISILTSSCPITGGEGSTDESTFLNPQFTTCTCSKASKLEEVRSLAFANLNRLTPPVIDHQVPPPVIASSQAAVDMSGGKESDDECNMNVRHSSLSPFPIHFKLSPDRKIKSAEDLKSLVLDLTKASRMVKKIGGKGIALESLVPPDYGEGDCSGHCDDEIIATTCT